MIATTPAGALFSVDRKYRYALWRVWDSSKPKVMLVGLNPSTAAENKNDPTISRLVGPSGLLGKKYGGFIMTNLFGFVTPHPEDLITCEDPISETDMHMHSAWAHASDVIFCWGNFREAYKKVTVIPDRGYDMSRADQVIEKYPNALCFGKNFNGSPKHPLYLKGGTKLVKF